MTKFLTILGILGAFSILTAFYSAGQMWRIESALPNLAPQDRAALAAFVLKAMFFTGYLTVTGVAIILTGGFYRVRAWVEAPLLHLQTAAECLVAGSLEVKIAGEERQDEFGALARALRYFKESALERRRLEQEIKSLTQQLEAERGQAQTMAGRQKYVVDALAAGLEQLACGDLLFRLTADFTGEYEKLQNDFNAAMNHLQATMKSIMANTQGVRTGVAEITQASDDLSQRTERQAASLEQTAAALDEITATLRKSAERAAEARNVVTAAKSDAERSGEVVHETVTAMGGIEKSSVQIANIIGVIDEIAFQTNLLALNAGVEAARAGDAGRGFAVVATEVRALAQRSADAAKEIKALISTSGAQVSTGVKLVGETGKSLGRIIEHVNRLNTLVADIAASAQEQAMGLSEVNIAVNQMDQVTQQNAAMVEESTAASHSLAHEAEALSLLIGKFQIGEQVRIMVRPVVAPPPRHPLHLPVGKFVPVSRPVQLSAAGSENWDEF